MNKERGLVIMVQEDGSRRDTFLVEQSKGHKVWSAIQMQRSGRFC